VHERSKKKGIGGRGRKYLGIVEKERGHGNAENPLSFRAGNKREEFHLLVTRRGEQKRQELVARVLRIKKGGKNRGYLGRFNK